MLRPVSKHVTLTHVAPIFKASCASQLTLDVRASDGVQREQLPDDKRNMILRDVGSSILEAPRKGIDNSLSPLPSLASQGRRTNSSMYITFVDTCKANILIKIRWMHLPGNPTGLLVFRKLSDLG